MAQILIVEDSDKQRDELEKFLTAHGYTVDTAEDGVTGLAKVKANPNLKLVILDIDMPNMDGLTMGEKIRQELDNRGVTLLALTATGDANVKARRKLANIRVWGVKPFNGESALEVIKKLV